MTHTNYSNFLKFSNNIKIQKLQEIKKILKLKKKSLKYSKKLHMFIFQIIPLTGDFFYNGPRHTLTKCPDEHNAVFVKQHHFGQLQPAPKN
jgi:hypothetical protein